MGNLNHAVSLKLSSAINYFCKWLSTGLLIHILSKTEGGNVNISSAFSLQKPLGVLQGSAVFPFERRERPGFQPVCALQFSARPSALSLCLTRWSAPSMVFDVAVEHLCDLPDSSFSVQIRRQKPGASRGERLVDAAFDAHVAFPADEQPSGRRCVFGDDVHQRSVALLLVNRLVERHGGIERDAFVSSRS